jgi:hypothetical protein
MASMPARKAEKLPAIPVPQKRQVDFLNEKHLKELVASGSYL